MEVLKWSENKVEEKWKLKGCRVKRDLREEGAGLRGRAKGIKREGGQAKGGFMKLNWC